VDFRIRQLQCFLTLSELLNYGKTARALYISQPTITFQIQTLEDAFGVKLFERDRKRVRLTEAGVVLRNYAQNIMDTIATAHKHLGGIDAHLHVRAAWGPGGVVDLLPVVYRVLLNRYPGFELEVEDLTTEEQMTQLSEQLVDALVMVPSMPIAGASFHPLSRAPLVAIVARNSALAERGSLSVYDLHEQNLITTRPEDCRFQQPFLSRLLGPYGVQPRMVESPQSNSVQFAYVASGAGVVITPHSPAYDNLADLIPIPFVEPLPWVELGCMIRQNNRSEATTLFRAVVTQCANRLYRDSAGRRASKPPAHGIIASPRLKEAV
jgi:DNA-binding transcriptional LysR family regulator